MESKCEHKVEGFFATKFLWIRGTFLMVCRICGAELRDRSDPATSHMN